VAYYFWANLYVGCSLLAHVFIIQLKTHRHENYASLLTDNSVCAVREWQNSKIICNKTMMTCLTKSLNLCTSCGK